VGLILTITGVRLELGTGHDCSIVAALAQINLFLEFLLKITFFSWNNFFVEGNEESFGIFCSNLFFKMECFKLIKL
jgi:hypothetical protein